MVRRQEQHARQRIARKHAQEGEQDAVGGAAVRRLLEDAARMDGAQCRAGPLGMLFGNDRAEPRRLDHRGAPPQGILEQRRAAEERAVLLRLRAPGRVGRQTAKPGSVARRKDNGPRVVAYGHDARRSGSGWWSYGRRRQPQVFSESSNMRPGAATFDFNAR
jgi:hypothetical protein